MLDANSLLAVWEEAENLPPTRKALALLHAAFPAMSREQWAGVALGRRDWYLLYLREQLFGEQLDAVASCPACGEKLETGFTLGQICPPGWELQRVPGHWQAHAPGAGGSELSTRPAVHLPATDGCHTLLASVPCSADVMASSQLPASALLQRCVQLVSDDVLHDDAPPGGATAVANSAPDPERMLGSPMRNATESVTGNEVPGHVMANDMTHLPTHEIAHLLDDALLQTLAQKMQELDPLAEIRIDLQCPSCRHGWTLDFDIVQWLWQEIGDWATRMLQQVHALAQAYGWSEASILAMSAKRRRRYLEMLGYT